MPRSIQQLKHREIHFADLSPEAILNAALRLEKMPGVSAEPAPDSVTVHYWVDEYTLADLEHALACSGFQLDESAAASDLRHRILHDEETEREKLAITHRPSCKSCGVFAHRVALRKDDLDTLPIYQ